MSRPTEFFLEDETVYWYVSIVDVDGTPLDADSDPTLVYRRTNGTGTTTTGVGVTKVSGTTGLYQFRHNTSLDTFLVPNTTIHYEEIAVINGVTYYNRWTSMVRSVASLSAQTAQTSTLNTIGVQSNDIQTKVTSIVGKTDQLAFTVANQVDANALSGGTNPTDITNAVWNPQLDQHQQIGSTGEALQKASVETQNAYVLPISTSDPCAPRGTALTAFINGAATFVLEFKDASGAIVDPTAESLYFVVEDGSTGTDMVVIPDGSLTKTTKNISVTVPGSDNTPIGSYRWAVRTESNEKVLGYGVYNIQYAAQDDTP